MLCLFEGLATGAADGYGRIAGKPAATFGHLGDGNLHVIVQVRPQDYMAARPKIEAMVYGGLRAFNGSVSAEHGIGLEKKPWLGISRNATELALMKSIKQLLDPKSLLNPGKIF